MSSIVTSPPLKSLTAAMRSIGTPFVFHCVTADTVTPNRSATNEWRPRSASIQSEKFMDGNLALSKCVRQVKPKSEPDTIRCMADKERRAALRQYIANLQGGRAEFHKRVGLTAGRITQLLDDEQPFGERAALAIARKLRLPDDYFERKPGAFGLLPEHMALIHAYDALLPEQQRAVLADLQARAQENRRNYELLQRKFGVNGTARDVDVAKHIPPAPAKADDKTDT